MNEFKRLPITIRIHICLLFVLFIDSMYPWYHWDSSWGVVPIVLAGSIAVFNIFYYKLFYNSAPIFFLFIMCVMYLWGNRNFNFIGFFLNVLFTLFNLFALVLYESDVKKYILRFITNGMAVFLGISLLSYIIYLFGLYPISPSRISSVASGYSAYNYYLFIIPNTFEYSFYRRFCSIFAEPGHLAVGLVFLMAVNRFCLSKLSVIVFFVGILFSFSLAGIITTFLGILFYNFSLKKIRNVVLFGCLLFVAVFIVKNFSNEDILDIYIFNRFEETADGSLKIKNNRTTYFYDNIFDETVKNPITFIFGQDEKIVDYSGGNAGYKVFIVKNGVLGVLLVVMFYTWNLFRYKEKEYVYFTIILSLIFVQGFVPFWMSVILPYILCPNYTRNLNYTK